jgi:MarR family transcriptional regulator, transcriptional regulator for hemolysin
MGKFVMRKGESLAADAKLRFASDIHAISQRWMAGLGERMKPTGLEGQLWFVLYVLSEVPKPATQRAVAERAGISPPTLVRLLDALEQRGLIQRGPVEGDRRANAIRMTSKAEPLLKNISDVAEAWRTELLLDVSPSDLDTCVYVLDKVRNKMSESTGKRPSTLALIEVAAHQN